MSVHATRVPLTPPAHLRADAIFAELMLLQKEQPQYSLLRFERLASARQYSRLCWLVWELLPTGAHVLDWGCGNGHFSYALLRSGYRVSAFAMEEHRLPYELKPGIRDTNCGPAGTRTPSGSRTGTPASTRSARSVYSNTFARREATISPA